MMNSCNCNKSDENKSENTAYFNKEVIESIGRIHNLALDQISQLPKFPKESKHDSYTVIIKILDQELRKFGIQTLFPSLNQLEKSSKEINKKLDEVINELFFDGKINFTERKNIEFILATTKALKDPSELDIELRAFESSIFASKELSSQEKTLIGIASVIARSSDSYWTRQLNNLKSSWYKVLIDSGINSDNKFKINWADLIGGVAGCGLCAIVGGIMGCIGCAAAGSTFASNVFKNN